MEKLSDDTVQTADALLPTRAQEHPLTGEEALKQAMAVLARVQKEDAAGELCGALLRWLQGITQARCGGPGGDT